MENSQPSLATDSFSYSWLVNPRPNSMDETPSIDFPGGNDPRQTHNNFSFDVSISSTDDFDDHHLTSLPLVHADKLFSNGRLMPAFPSTTTPSTHSFPSTSNQINSTSSPSPSFETSVSASLIRHHQKSIFPRKFSRFSRKFLHKYLGFLLPSCPIGASPRRRRCKRVDDLDRRAQEVKSLNNTPETVSPRLSTASAYSNWSDYADTSIYEAILYCKKSSEQ